MFRVVVAAVLCAALSATGARAQTPPQPDIRWNVSYGADPAQRLDLCLPAAQAGGGRPAVVMIHGGYWTMGDKGAYAQLCKTAADQGIVAAAIDYRLANGSPHNRWPAQLVDAQLAVRWLRAHAAEFGVDPKKICALGDSAGAHLAVFLGVLDKTAPGDAAGEMSSVSSKVACVVDNFGPVDISSDTMWPPDQQLFGSDGHQRPTDQERAASPLYLVGPGTAPTLIAHGRQDKSVNVDQSLALLDQLKRAHVPARIILLDGGHEFEGLSMPEIQTVQQTELNFIKSH